MGKANSVKLSLEEQSTKVCKECGVPFNRPGTYVKYCSNKCRYKNQNRENYKRHKETLLEKKRLDRITNPDKFAARWAKWSSSNKNHLSEYKKERAKRQPELRLFQNISRGVRLCLNGTTKKSSSLGYCGCTKEHLVAHLEKQFTKGMTWENYGVNGWHLDHIRPKCSFDLTKDSEMRKCWHFTNLQPLWAKDNLSKGGRY